MDNSNNNNDNNDDNNTINTINSDSDTEIDTKVIVNPYNFNNKLINENFITSIFNRFGMDYVPNDMSLYQHAFIHKSYCVKKLVTLGENTVLVDKPEGALPLMEYDNERLEFLGDSILSPIVANYLYERYPEQDEGFMTKMRTKLVCGETLAKFSRELGFGEYIIVSRHIEDKCNGRNSTSILEDAFEAFIGALFQDFNSASSDSVIGKRHKNCYSDFCTGVGFQVAQELFINIVEEYIDFSELVLRDFNYKDQLLKYFQRTFHIPVKYTEIECEGMPNERVYTMGVLDAEDKIVTMGSGKSKKKAEQEASRNALIYYDVIKSL